MNALQKAPTILTRVGAEKITARIARQLESADADLARAYEGRVWEALDLPTWEAWVEQRLPELSCIRLAVPVRLETTLALRLVGASERAISSATGVSRGQAHADLQALRDAGRLNDQQSRTESLDGRSRPAVTGTQARAAAQVQRHGLTILMHEAWQHVAGREDLTCLELERKARWRHGRASSLLHRLERAGLVERTGTFRDGYGAYRARPLD